MTPTETVAIVFIAGFAIQQVLQFIDPFVIAFMNKLKGSGPDTNLPGGISEADFKKALMAFLSFLLGMAAVGTTGIRLLEILDYAYKGIGDFFVSALVVGTGTEATNSVLKFLGYVKDAQKPSASISISILTPAVTVQQKGTFQFTAVVRNSDNRAVNWKVLHGSGGTITPQGLYTAPGSKTNTIVMASSAADPTQQATATVTVP